ncbi:protein of unknown function (plasmid) [Shinella sp. WSC3-e]|nr:protein of unknown function [Shinella sp. WSC3-e]
MSTRSVAATAVNAGRDCMRGARPLQSADQAHNESAQWLRISTTTDA